MRSAEAANQRPNAPSPSALLLRYAGIEEEVRKRNDALGPIFRAHRTVSDGGEAIHSVTRELHVICSAVLTGPYPDAGSIASRHVAETVEVEPSSPATT